MEQDSKGNQAKYVELNLFPEEIEDYQKDSISSESKEKHTSSDKEYDLKDLFERLSQSAFRSRFHLSKKDKEYIAEKGLATIRKHAEDFKSRISSVISDGWSVFCPGCLLARRFHCHESPPSHIWHQQSLFLLMS